MNRGWSNLTPGGKRRPGPVNLAPWRIGDVARKVGVTVVTLRYWEQEFRLRPKRSKGGQRYYSPEQVSKLRSIKKLLHTRLYTVAGAKKKLGIT